MNLSPHPFPFTLKGQLIVSCQAPPGDPLDDIDTLRRLAVSALRGGAKGLRANGAEAIRAFRKETTLPIVGILKRYDDNELCITPNVSAVQQISEAGADVIALDCTADRPAYSEPWPELIRYIHEVGKPALADIATLDEAIAAEKSGADAVATTLYGYTQQTAGIRSPNWELIDQLVKAIRIPVIAEGHLTRPEEFRRALDMGAFAVVIGAAITRPEAIAARFIQAMR
jgi:N-acylglucosamine-6-phosphate 2-epimerase